MSFKFRRVLFASATLFLAAIHPPADASSWDACFAALNQGQPALAVKEANTLLRQKKLPKEAGHYANLCLGRAWKVQGDFKQALPPLREAARLATGAEQRYAAHSWLGATLQTMGVLDEAAEAHEIELEAAIQLGDAGKEAIALNNLGNIAYRREQYDQAVSLFTRSLVLQTEESEKAAVLNNIASVHSNKGSYALAVDAYQQAIAIVRKLGKQGDLTMHLLNLGATYRRMQRWQETGQALNEGLQTAQAIGNRYLEGLGFAQYGAAFRDGGDNATARENFNVALKIFREIGATAYVTDVQDELQKLGE